MNKAIIFGVFEFLGFHLCKKILDEGIEVEGVHIDAKSEELYIEEKKLEIGRNANFVENELENWNIHNNSEAVLFIDFYDLFMKNCEEKLSELNIFDELEKEMHFILLVPVVLLSNEDFQDVYQKIVNLMERIREKGAFVQAFYLPSLYGPWQPNEFAFQKMISENKVQISKRESTYDAIYIEDAVEKIINEVHKENEEYLIRSKTGHSWKQCAELLNISYPLEKQGDFDFKGKESIVDSHTPISVGLKKQKQYSQWRE